jgi:hypothetical protein
MTFWSIFLIGVEQGQARPPLSIVLYWGIPLNPSS